MDMQEKDVIQFRDENGTTIDLPEINGMAKLGNHVEIIKNGVVVGALDCGELK